MRKTTIAQRRFRCGFVAWWQIKGTSCRHTPFAFIAVFLSILAGGCTVTRTNPATASFTSYTLPASLKGFSGTIEGIVLSKRERDFVIKATKITGSPDGQSASRPVAAIGRHLQISAQWAPGESGWMRPIPEHLSWIQSLRVNRTISVSVINDETDRLHIVEIPAGRRTHGR